MGSTEFWRSGAWLFLVFGFINFFFCIAAYYYHKKKEESADLKQDS